MREKPILDAFMDTADGAFATDARGTVVRWNSEAERITGRKASESIGRPCWEVMDGRDSARNLVCFPECHVMAMARRGEQPSHQDLLLEAHNQDLAVDISTTLVRDEDRNVQAIVHTFRDVTEQRQMETHLRRALGDRADPGSASGGGPPESIQRLTKREHEILKLLAAGLPTRTVASELAIRPATVRNHVQNILKKLGVHSKLEAAVLANRYSL